MLDTNVLISLIIFESRTIREAVEDIAENHEMLACTFVLDEIRDVVARKWPSHAAEADRFIGKMPLEIVETPATMDESLFNMRDAKDFPVLYSAIIGNADILVTGDKDFFDIELKKPEILRPAEYVAKYAH